MRAVAIAILLSGCTSLPTPVRDNEVGNYLSGTCWQGAQKAMTGDPAGFHESFFAAYSRVRDPMMGGEDIESIRETIAGLLAAVDDEAFSSHLRVEPEPVRSGVAWFLSTAKLSDAPETHRVIAETRDYDFELEQSYRRNKQ